MVKKLLGAAALLCALLSNTVAQAQSYCTPICYYGEATSCSYGYSITDFSTSGATVDIANDGSGCNSGFVTGQSCTAGLGAVVSYNMQLQGAYARGMWIDWNHDYDFDDAGEEIFFYEDLTDYMYDRTSSGNITVPEDAVTGTTRMRIRAGLGYMSQPFDACSATDYSEYEDYNFTVTEAECGDEPTAGTVALMSGSTTNCVGADIILTATGYTTGNGISLQWMSMTAATGGFDYIPGATDAAYTAFGLTESTSYILNVTCASSSMMSMSNTVVITVNQPETPAITLYKPATICYLSQSIFNVTGTDLGEEPVYTWFRNSVEIEGATEASYTTSDISKYADEVIAVTVSNINGECISGAQVSENVTVKALSPLDPNVTYTTTSGSTKLCEGDAVTFLSKSAAAPNAGFSWSRDGVLIEGENGSSYTTDQPGAIIATATSEEGCTRSTTSARVINPKPTATVTEVAADAGAGTAGSFCTGSFLTLGSNTNAAGASYRWKLNGDNKGVAVNQKVNAAGDYTVTVTKNGCAATSDPYTVTEKTTNVFVTTEGAPLSFCTPSFVSLLSPINGDYTYQWYKSSTPIAGETMSYYEATASGTYRVAIKNGGCPEKKSATMAVTARPTPVATISRASKQPAYWTLRANPGAGDYYQWFKDGETVYTTNGRELNVTENGNYTVIVFKGMCFSELSADYVVNSTTFAAPGARTIAGVANEEVLINIFPNPSTGIFNIGSEQPVNVVVKDVQGRVVMDVRNASSIDLTNQVAGMYIMSITDADGKLLQVERVVKQ
jgi:hypothetical protein